MKDENQAKGKMDRRRFLYLAGSIGAAVTAGSVLAACSPSKSSPGTGGSTGPAASGGGGGATASPGEVVFVSWGGSYQDYLRETQLKPFQAKSGIVVKDVSPLDFGKVQAMVQYKNVEWDVIDPEGEWAVWAAANNLLEPLDYNVIKTDGLAKDGVAPNSVVYESYTTAISYSTKKWAAGQGPKSWADFWDTKKFPGKRCMYKSPTGTLEAALLADGVAPDKLYPLDVDRAFKSLDRIRSSVTVWWSQGAQSAQVVASDEVDMISAWHNRVLPEIKKGAKWFLNYSNAVVHTSRLCVPKGAPHKANAMKLIAALVSPEVNATWADYGILPVNSKSYELLKPETAAQLPTKEQMATMVTSSADWWQSNRKQAEDRFNQWLVQG